MAVHARYLLLSAITATLLAGCGGSESAEPKSAAQDTNAPTIRNAPRWDEQQVISAAGLVTDDGGINYHTNACDQIAVVLTSKNAVDLYAGAGDTVVTNPDGTAGVKVISADKTCLSELQRNLAQLK